MDVDDDSTVIGISTIFFIMPPLFPSKPIVVTPIVLHTFNPLKTFFEFPLVDMPITVSPFETRLSHCLENISSKEKSFAMEVIVEESVVSDIAGKLFLFNLKRPINSAAICCASAALPPFPNSTIFFPFLNVLVISRIDFSILPDRVTAVSYTHLTLPTKA